MMCASAEVLLSSWVPDRTSCSGRLLPQFLQQIRPNGRVFFRDYQANTDQWQRTFQGLPSC